MGPALWKAGPAGLPFKAGGTESSDLLEPLPCCPHPAETSGSDCFSTNTSGDVPQLGQLPWSGVDRRVPLKQRDGPTNLHAMKWGRED